MKVKKLHPDAVIPTRGSEHSAGLDLYAIEDISLPPRNGGVKVRTGIAVAIPAGNYGKVEARSGMSFNSHIETGAGVVDADYRGEVNVKLYNHSGTWFHVTKGMRIAQLIVQSYVHVEPEETDDLDATERGEKGLGSTGK